MWKQEGQKDKSFVVFALLVSLGIHHRGAYLSRHQRAIWIMTVLA